MDITSFVFRSRERALAVGDYNSYRRQLTRQLLSLRRKLGRNTPHKAKYATKAPITPQDVVTNHSFIRILLLQAERAWALAMHIKSTHAEDNASKGISGPTRKHIISRLHKAATYAQQLLTLVTDRSIPTTSERAYLEAHAYSFCIAGAEQFEKQATKRFDDPNVQKQAWSRCLTSFSEAHVIYTALYSTTQKAIFKDALITTVEPSIRYAAYQSRIARTVPIPTVAKRHFPREKSDLLAVIEKYNPNALNDEVTPTATTEETINPQNIPTSISWRGRKAPIADAAIGQAMAATSTAAAKLNTAFATPPNTKLSRRSGSSSASEQKRHLAAAYDPVLTNAQDTVDAVRRAIADLQREGVSESDTRMQDLRVSDLATNYTLISWRVGRNRVLTSDSSIGDDGITFNHLSARKPRNSKMKATPSTMNNASNLDNIVNAAKSEQTPPLHPEAHASRHPKRSIILSILRERAVLYDSTLQSLESILSLRGASSSAEFMAEINRKKAYFQSIKCLNIGRSHDTVGSKKEALSLFVRALNLLLEANPDLPKTAAADTNGDVPMSDANTGVPPTSDVLPSQLNDLYSTLKLTVHQYRGLVTLQTLFPFPHPSFQATQIAQKPTPNGENQQTQHHSQPPLISNLNDFPILVPEGTDTAATKSAGTAAPSTLPITNLVTYPPRLQPVPVKPIFLDIAWNYIEYPGRDEMRARDTIVSTAADTAAAAASSAAKVGGKIANALGAGATDGQSRNDEDEVMEDEEEPEPTPAPAPKKRGWFGFGRS